MAAALRGIAAGQFEQTLLDIPLDLDLVGAEWLPTAQQGEIHPLGNQLPTNPGNRPQADAQGRDDLLIGAFLAAGIVRQQEDAGMGQLAGCGLSPGNHPFQLRPLFLRQGHSIFVHSSHPILSGVIV